MVADCECGRGPVAVAVFRTKNRVLVRRLVDVPHVQDVPPDAACVDCAADAAAAVPVEFANTGTSGDSAATRLLPRSAAADVELDSVQSGVGNLYRLGSAREEA